MSTNTTVEMIVNISPLSVKPQLATSDITVWEERVWHVSVGVCRPRALHHQLEDTVWTAYSTYIHHAACVSTASDMVTIQQLEGRLLLAILVIIDGNVN